MNQQQSVFVTGNQLKNKENRIVFVENNGNKTITRSETSDKIAHNKATVYRKKG